MPARKPASKKSSSAYAAARSRKMPEEKPAEPPTVPVRPRVALRADDGDEPITLECDVKLQKAAMQWRSIVRNRRRWADSKQTRDEKDENAYAQLLMLGLTEKELQRIAAARIIEVAIPFESETIGWEARIIPWEYLLSAATRKIRPTGRLTVVRHLSRQNQAIASRATASAPPASALYVESAPGKLSNEYNFSTERRLVESSLVPPLAFRPFKDPTANLLKQAIAQESPGVIHLAGFDSHQWANLSAQESADTRDGYLMAGEMNNVEVVSAEALAGVLNAGQSKPLLVGCNIYNSASRICALTVAAGAGAAIGFQDEFDDSLAELLFCTFYQSWKSEWKLLESFQAACQILRDQPANLNGTGVVLWSDHSLLPGQPAQQPAAETRRARGAKPTSFSYPLPPVATPSAEPKPLSAEKVQLLTPADRSAAAAILQVEAKPLPELNYSALHNNRPLFQSFKIIKGQMGRAEQVSIDVTLHVGGQPATYSGTFDLIDPLFDPNRDKIRVQLLHSAWADLAECVLTSLAVKVNWGKFNVYSQTFTVKLLPLDQWRDDDVDRIWLPSFVLPRDPAVRRVVNSAQRYLMALRDDGGAGFDGYQSFDNSPGLQPEVAAEGVDDQVRALWATLVYDSSIAYINPPPTYSKASQRLRPPLEVLDGGRGTCIDTTLLLASCLEYIEIYPVIFLLNGHAFVGYWRSDKYRDEFIDLVEGSRIPDDTGDVKADAATANLSEETGSRDVPSHAWYFEKKRDNSLYDLIVQKVREGKLVPLESTWLTRRGSFWDAIDEGGKNLQFAADFDAMLDIQEARGKVTPIPLRGK